MKTHVSGVNTPLSLGELRLAILAAVIGNPLFTDEEQLLTNHHTFDCETAGQLAGLLHQMQEEAARRELLVQAQALADETFLIAGTERLQAEFAAIVQYPDLEHVAYPLRRAFERVGSDYDRVGIIGEVWAMALERTGHFKQAAADLN